jgi:tetratricopeptide (TPR) repeat protein
MMKNLIHEIHRRSLWQVLGIYLAGSWIALQVVETLSESMSLPSWVQGFSVILLILGLPIVLATAFVQEGVGRREAAARRDEPDTVVVAVPSPDDGVDPEPVQVHPPVSESRPSPLGGLFTWRKAIVGGVLAFALLGVSLVGWVVLRSMGVGPAGTLVAKGLLEERSTLLLTDFVAEDPSLSRAATEALRVDLSQSNVVKVADPGVVLAALNRMERSAEDGLDAAVGRELAQREGMPALVTGDVTAAGAGYVLTAQILTTETGEVLVAERVTASDDSDVIGAIDQLSKKLRERIGESLGDLATTPPLERVTTGDLEALRLYSRALGLSDAGDNPASAALLEEAVTLDTAFAMAWRKLGALYTSGGGALGRFSRGIEAYDRAYRFRDRLTERERLLTTAGYFDNVRRDLRRAADAYEQMLERDPEDTWALNNLGIIMGSDLEQDEVARSLLQRAIELEPSSSNAYWNLSVTQGRTGAYEDARETLDAWKANIPGDATPYMFHSALEGSIRRYDAADSLARLSVSIRPGNTLDASFAAAGLAATADIRGRLAEGEGLRDEEEDLNRQLGPGQALGAALVRVDIELEVRRNPAAAVQTLDQALREYPLTEMGPLDPPWQRLVTLEARLNGPVAARERMAQWESADPQASSRPSHTVASGWIDLSEGDPDGALSRVQGVRDPECLSCAPFLRLAAARMSGATDAIIEHGESFVESDGLFQVFGKSAQLGPALEELGQILDETGDLQNAARYYAAFVELWQTADEELQPRVAAAQARLEEILREIG